MTATATATLRGLAISPTGFVFDPATGTTFSVNDTGRIILESIRDGRDLGEITQVLDNDFDTDGGDLERDVLEYVRMLRELALLPADFELE